MREPEIIDAEYRVITKARRPTLREKLAEIRESGGPDPGPPVPPPTRAGQAIITIKRFYWVTVTTFIIFNVFWPETAQRVFGLNG